MLLKKIIVRLRMWYADIKRSSRQRDGTMNQVIGIWADTIRKKKDD